MTLPILTDVVVTRIQDGGHHALSVWVAALNFGSRPTSSKVDRVISKSGMVENTVVNVVQ